jgi:predicted ATPase/DNA-binding winged helix-turn-helix (wHTH) protein/tetratricopeptide (TPR) repeat protein
VTSDDLCFDTFELLPVERRLVVGGVPVAIGTRAFDVLVALAERAGKLVSKQELLDLAWPGLVVEENNLQVQITTLRKLLGPQAIATIPGRGYRLAMARKGTTAPDPAAARPREGADAETPITGTGDLFGRQDDIDSLGKSIREHGLVTIIGPAGIGKTRLAEAAARRHVGSFADGMRWVELAPLVDATLVAPTIARALGVAMGDAPPSLERALQALASQRLLLVLDNCEHVLEAVDAFVAPLRRCAPGIHVLATSQELLRHPDEHVYRLGPLFVPGEDADVTALDKVNEAGAVQLFVARVRALANDFALTAKNVAGVVEICRRLDGIPLAIELGAARVPLLGVDGVRQRLDERFRLLTGGARVALRRHQTLRAALEWSHSLLTAPEKAVFAALGVFSGSFSLDSVQALVAGPEMDAWAVLEHLGALVDKSLVAVEGSAADVPRYRLLETTRAFALERLAASGATPRTLRRHAEVTLEIFEHAHRDLMSGMPSADLVPRLTPNLDNLRGALRWAAGADGDDRLAVALFGAAIEGQGHFYFFALGAETWRWRHVLRPRVALSMPGAIAARFWLACAQWGSILSPKEAADDARRAIALYTALGDRFGTFRSWQALAYAHSSAGRHDEALEALRPAIELRDPTWPQWILALFDYTGGIVCSQAGDLARARRHYTAFLEVCGRIGPVDELNATALLVDLDVAEGLVRKAGEQAAAMIARPGAMTLRWSDGRGLRMYATALMVSGRLDDAERVYRQSLGELRRYYGNGAATLLDAATWLARKERLEDAARVLAYAEAVHESEGRSPRFVARQLRDRLHAELAQRFAADRLARLYEEGRSLSDDAACELTFPSR